MTIRRQPSDFVVEEQVAAQARGAWRSVPAGSHPHAVFELAKTSLTTPDAVGLLAKALGARAGEASYAGLKDKHAQTKQHVSLRFGDRASAERVRLAAAGGVTGRGWSARLVGWAQHELNADAIAVNQFTIVVRDLSPAACAAMDERAAFLRDKREAVGADEQALDRLLVVNYFGDQRFGSARHGRGFAARALIAGHFEEALKLAIATPARKDAPRAKQARRAAAERWGRWAELLAVLPKGPERRVVEVLAAGGDFPAAYAALPHLQQLMTIEAYQSYLWNAMARRLAEELAAANDLSGADDRAAHGATEARMLHADDIFGAMAFPSPGSVTRAWREVRAPLLAAETRLEGPWSAAAERVLQDEGLTIEQLRIPGVRRPNFGEAWRPVFVAAEGFEMTPPEPDELASGGRRLKRTVRFSLPRGAYATVLLRALGQ